MFLWYMFLFINKSFCQLLVAKNCQSRKITLYELCISKNKFRTNQMTWNTLCTNVNADAGCYFNSICISLTMLEQHILEYTNIYKWSPIPPFVKERIGNKNLQSTGFIGGSLWKLWIVIFTGLLAIQQKKIFFWWIMSRTCVIIF
jgi:hypothetical protein